MNSTAEHLRLAESRSNKAAWKLWGPYLSEREWGTVREDYSADGNAWASFTHQQAGARAYRWGEDGIAGISDGHQYLCFALALWNGEDATLKERIFGLAGDEGIHGEDVKEYYFYLDNTPTHSYMKYLYKYPQRKFPYEELVRANRACSRGDPEYELLDTGVLAGNRYFDVFVEYAKAAPKDILVSITACNRSTQAATLHLLPTLWFRNTWSTEGGFKPILFAGPNPKLQSIIARHRDLGEYSLYCEGAPELLFTENETNQAAMHGRRWFGFVKDAIDECVVRGHRTAINPKLNGTKGAAHYLLKVPSRGEAVVRLRLRDALFRDKDPFRHFDHVFAARRREADVFYDTVIPSSLSKDEANVMRQALSGMLWNKQFYNFDLERWSAEHESPAHVRNQEWRHMVNSDVISMPDKWEYPRYTAWELAFHTIPLALVDFDFAKKQLAVMLSEPYLHPSGQIPANEWNFSDVHPPVHAWALLQLASLERELHGTTDLNFLKLAFNRLLLNFTWWMNRKDDAGKHVLEGGFLGLDNLGIFDCHAPLTTGGYLREADGASWMAFFSQCMLQIALTLAWHDATYADLAVKFLDHFLQIGASMHREDGLNGTVWDEEDGFFYDAVRLPDGNACLLRLRSMAGLIPLCATTTLEEQTLKRFPELRARARNFVQRHPGLLPSITRPDKAGANNRKLLALVNESKLRRVLARTLDENEFLGPYGIRSLSRCYAANPYIVSVEGNQVPVKYLPAESDSGSFGGNANWRGPIWFPFNFLLIHALHQFHLYYGDAFKVECPTGSGRLMDLSQVAHEIAGRLCAVFLKDAKGRRPVHGGAEIFADDPYWRDLILFYEYFHGDNGAGIGASHQTGWTGLVARLLHLKGTVEAASVAPARITEAFSRTRAS